MPNLSTLDKRGTEAVVPHNGKPDFGEHCSRTRTAQPCGLKKKKKKKKKKKEKKKENEKMHRTAQTQSTNTRFTAFYGAVFQTD